MAELKPCPFCGWKPMIIVDEKTEEKFGVKCFSCYGMIEPRKETKDEAIKAWNRRIKNG